MLQRWSQFRIKRLSPETHINRCPDSCTHLADSFTHSSYLHPYTLVHPGSPAQGVIKVRTKQWGDILSYTEHWNKQSSEPRRLSSSSDGVPISQMWFSLYPLLKPLNFIPLIYLIYVQPRLNICCVQPSHLFKMDLLLSTSLVFHAH